MLCQDIMKRKVHCANANTTVLEAAALMRDEGIGFLPVCNEDRDVIGVLTDRDIAIRVVAAGEPTDQPVEPFMTRNIVACYAGEDLQAVQDLMGEMQVSRIICIDDNGRLEGVISLSDVAQTGDAAGATLRSVSEREARV